MHKMDVFTQFPKARNIEIERDKRVKIAYLHHNEDSFYFNPFYQKHLALLRRRGKIFDDLPEVPVGARFQDYMKPQLENADAIILFLSIDLEIDVNHNSSPEIIALIDACQKKGTRIWKVLTRSYAGDSVFQEYGYSLAKGKSILSIANSSDEALGQIAGEIDNEVTQMLSEKWVQEGDNYCHEMHFDEALAAYTNSLSYITDYPPALLGKWRIFRKKGMAEEAKQCLEELLSLDTSLPQKGKDALSLTSQRIFLMRSYCKGYAWLDKGKFNDAHTAFREVFQRVTSPDDKIQRKLCARAYCGEGDTFISEGRRSRDFANYYNQALDAYQNARSLDQDDPIYLTKIGDVYVAFAEAYAALNDRVWVNDCEYNALKMYKQVISCYLYPPAFVGQGNIHFILKRFNQALDAYDYALELDQFNAHAHGGKGNVLLALNNPEEALLAFEQALSIDSCNVQYHYSKGRALAWLKRYQEAFASYKMASNYGLYQSREFLINYMRTILELGDAESAYGQQSKAEEYYAEAEDFYLHAFEPRRNEKDIKYGCGKIYFAKKNWNIAAAFYNEAISIAVDMGEAHLGMGKTYLECDNIKSAFDCFELANKYCQRPESLIDRSDVETVLGDAYYYIAEHFSSEDHERSLEDACLCYKRAIQVRENAMAYAGLGKTYAKLCRDQEAIDALSQAVELMPNFVQCCFIKGQCCYKLGKYLEAYTEYKRASKAGLNTVPLQKAFGEVLIAMKRYKDALQMIDTLYSYMFKDISKYTDQDFAYIFCMKGLALYGQEEDGKAIYFFFEAYRCDHSISWERQYRQALEDIYYRCQKKLANNLNDPIIHRHKGDVLWLLEEQNEKAINAYTNAIAYGDISADAYYSRGSVYESIEDYQNAFNDYCTALQIDPNYQAAYRAKLRVESKIVQPQPGFWQKLKSRLNL